MEGSGPGPAHVTIPVRCRGLSGTVASATSGCRVVRTACCRSLCPLLPFAACVVRCVSTGNEIGMLQVVLNADTLAGIVVDSVNTGKGLGRKLMVAKNVLKDNVLHKWLMKQPVRACWL